MNSKKTLTYYGRFKDTPWFDQLSNSRVIVFGAGGIGSWLSFFLARTGSDVVVVDMDTVEDHNLGLQN
jgi:tRNA A37 threonylcarbamoyladenosine dehydratase